MNRRSCLRLIAGIAAGSASLWFPPAIPTAYAIAPAVALMLVSTAINLVNLFSQGTGVGPLLQLQVEMLKHISEQLGAIQKEVLEILNRLDQLEQLVGQIPEKVVIELYRAKISGLNGRYQEIMATYRADLAQGIEAAQSRNSAELEEELLKPLRESRDILMSYNSFGLIPIVCSSAFVETHAMIMGNYRRTRFIEAIKRYEAWLSTITNGTTEASLTGAILGAQKQQSADKGRIPGSESHECVTSWNVYLPGQSHCAGGSQPEGYGTYNSVQFTLTINKFISPDVDRVVNELISSSIMPEDERPIGLGAGVTERSGNLHLCAKHVQPEGKDEAWLTEIIKNPCPNLVGKVSDVAQLSTTLTDDGIRLLSLHSLKYAADNGLAFLKRMKDSADMLQ